jgi:DNA gyrase/topoisomerase IV subunit A
VEGRLTVITPDKIEEWLKEIEDRPTSAPIILQYISNRLRDLTSRNEELLDENIALTSEKRVEEYENRIAHLEYQLELLKRQLGNDQTVSENAFNRQNEIAAPPSIMTSILIYDQKGRIVRLEIKPGSIQDGTVIGEFQEPFQGKEEQPRLMVVSSTEELLCVYNSGRVSTLPVANIPSVRHSTEAGMGKYHWNQAFVPEEAQAGEKLACLVPISNLPLAEFFVQTSRRGFVKKIRTAMAQTILGNHYIGSGVKLPLDRTFSIDLCDKLAELILVSYEGYLIRFELNKVSASSEEIIRLGTTDYLVASFVHHLGTSILVLTQIGKAIQLTDDRIALASSKRTKGQSVISSQRREKGARVVWAGLVEEDYWSVGLHQDGRILTHSIKGILDSGLLKTESQIVAFAAFSAAIGK